MVGCSINTGIKIERKGLLHDENKVYLPAYWFASFILDDNGFLHNYNIINYNIYDIK